MLKFLIDECVSPELAQLARDRGYHESFHVSWLGKAGWKDWELKDLILEQDWTFVTRNSVDFRGSAEQPGSKGQYADVPIHAGLVCINGSARMSGKIQVELFAAVLDTIQDMIQGPSPPQEDLVNEVIEVNLAEEGGEFEIVRYPLPVADSGTI
jgi:predicted nuclease of predicted toxin-antitoxin system